MATWNADKPALANQVTADIPDIEENFQELHDVVEAITNGTLGTTEPAAFSVDTVTAGGVSSAIATIMQGLTHRSNFEWKDADEIYIGAGSYYHVGTSSQVVYWNSKLTFQLQSGGSNAASDDYGADGWHYIYLDDSAIVTQGAALLDADCFLNDTTAPAWSETKHGWYNGDDRCIFAVYETGS